MGAVIFHLVIRLGLQDMQEHLSSSGEENVTGCADVAQFLN